MNIEKMREEFISWIESLNVGYNTSYFGGVLGESFNDAEVDGLWQCWQASASESKSALASQLVSVLSINRGRPIEWREAIEITAIITGMGPQEKQRLLDMDDD